MQQPHHNNNRDAIITSMPRRKLAYMLLEAVIALAIVALLIPVLFQFLLSEIRLADNLAKQSNCIAQSQFVNNYVQHLVDNSLSLNNNVNNLWITTSENTYQIGLKNKAVFTKRVARRYLSFDPFIVDSFQVQEIVPGFLLINLDVNKNKFKLPVVF